MNPALSNRLIKSRIRISDFENTRDGKSFNERCSKGKISLFNSLYSELSDSGGLLYFVRHCRVKMQCCIKPLFRCESTSDRLSLNKPVTSLEILICTSLSLYTLA
uniref:Uncharacterized protein n=1 Tax=Myoviridae sp. cta6i12 TaxID=2827695 RepID=A0A8S5T8C5_9CAUD|nr:MAG TPA: hypothetical protein [Myoviridae sp. cta6i12]